MKIPTAAERGVEAPRDIEQAAARLFATVGLDATAGEEPAGVGERLGFRVLGGDELTPELARIRSSERGLDREAARVAMKLDVVRP